MYFNLLAISQKSSSFKIFLSQDHQSGTKPHISHIQYHYDCVNSCDGPERLEVGDSGLVQLSDISNESYIGLSKVSSC